MLWIGLILGALLGWQVTDLGAKRREEREEEALKFLIEIVARGGEWSQSMLRDELDAKSAVSDGFEGIIEGASSLGKLVHLGIFTTVERYGETYYIFRKVS